MKIEKGIKPPKIIRSRNAKFVGIIRKMKPGDSIFYKSMQDKFGFSNAARKLGKKYITRTDGDGFRCWILK